MTVHLEISDSDQLTWTARCVAGFRAQGHTNNQIVEIMHVHRHTVERAVKALRAAGVTLGKPSLTHSHSTPQSGGDPQSRGTPDMVQSNPQNSTLQPPKVGVIHAPTLGGGTHGTEVALSDPDSSPLFSSLPSSPKDGSSKKKKTKSDSPVDPLYHSIMDAFLSQYPDRKASWNYRAQGRGVNLLVARCRQQSDPETFAQGVMEAYLSLTKGNDKFWRGQPFTPLNLNSEGIWTRVLTSMEEEPGLDIEAIVREATCRSTK